MAKPILNYAIPTDRAIQDLTTGKWSYIDIFSQINIPNDLELIALDFWIVGKVSQLTKGEETELEVRLLYPSKKNHTVIKLNGVAEGEAIDFATYIRGAVFKEPGQYDINIYVNGMKLADGARYSVLVAKVE